MPVCIAGMHRSGTSMIARLLNLCGLYLGNDEDLIPAAPDNPEGFWEHVQFVNLNEEMLSFFDGAWDFPPLLPAGWVDKPELMIVTEKAKNLTSLFAHREPWGWKDPRNSLTIDFWKSLFPDLKVIICLRDPVEVSASLHKRGYSSDAFAFNLWMTYNKTLRASLRPGQYLITHYESYFTDPLAELQRVAEFAGLDASERVLREALSAIKPGLRQHKVSTEKLPPEVADLYTRMRAEAATPFSSQKPIAQDAHDARALRDLADFTYVEMGRVEEALHLYTRVLAIRPDDVETLLILANICTTLKKTGVASLLFSRVLGLDPENEDALGARDALSRLRSENRALESPEKRYADIQILLNSTLFDDAIAGLEALVQDAPDFAVAHNDLGVLYSDRGAWEKAQRHYEQAVRLDPGNETFLGNLADLYLVALDRFDDAVRIYSMLLERHPDDAGARCALSRAKRARTNHDRMETAR